MSKGTGTIEGVLENYKQAVNERDTDRFLKMYSSDVHIYDCWGSWECRGIDAWRVYVWVETGGRLLDHSSLAINMQDGKGMFDLR
jgi:ketosteroid isomerase-like protein